MLILTASSIGQMLMETQQRICLHAGPHEAHHPACTRPKQFPTITAFPAESKLLKKV